MGLSQRQLPQLKINTINPFYRIQTAYQLFDQSKLPEDDRCLPLYRFQETILTLSTLYNYIKVHAPSQSGKTSIAELLAAIVAYEYPGCNIMLLSTKSELSEKLLREVKEKFIQCCRVERLRELKVDAVDELVIKANGSRIMAVPHSIKAIRGWPLKLLINDEIEEWDHEPDKIYAEGVARMGKTAGQIINISSVGLEGKADARHGFQGSFFYYDWKRTHDQNRKNDKNAVAIGFTYHASPHLVKNIDKIKEEIKIGRKGRGYFESHYLGIPRKAEGLPTFYDSFSYKDHVQPDEVTADKLNPNEPLFLCFDPGLSKAAVLGQLDVDAPRLLYLRNFLSISGDGKTWEDFCKEVLIKVNKEFSKYYIQLYMDVAGNKKNDQTYETNKNILYQISGQMPIAQWQNIEPGIEVMKSFMKTRDGFYVSQKASLVIDALESGLVCEERNGIPQVRYAKDGYYEHIGDCCRYPAHSITGGLNAASFPGYYQEVSLEVNQYVDPRTGY